MYSGNNEVRHTEILIKLIELGASPNANDINGYTPLHHVLLYPTDPMITALLKSGANPNFKGRDEVTPFSIMIDCNSPRQNYMEMIDLFLKHNAKLSDKKEASELRSMVESNGSKELAVRVREAMPRADNECEKCEGNATKKCSGCSLVYYCYTACQKQDWKFHKVTSQKMKNN